ncbi:TPA: MBL fold metallo-hydrolase [Photobacterium damselae]|uniref:MBL fold metallo-hydrolase n=1 Tax=Photobacterium damselae TaxID=38293 RepID=UPI0025439CC9
MLITVLVDNEKNKNIHGLSVERGLSYHIATMGKQILFDCGSSQVFCDNAKLLNVNIKDVDAAVISHRHHDHCNGVSYFLNYNSKAMVYIKKCEEKKYFFKTFGFKRNIGVNQKLFTQSHGRFEFVSEFTEICNNVFIATVLSKKFSQPKGNKYLFSKKTHCYERDLFEHELLMIIKENDGIVIFTGCSHAGVINMVETAIELFPNTRIKAVVGGFHLVGLPLFNRLGDSKKNIEAIGQYLLRYPIDKFYTGHCTGVKAYRVLKNILGERIEYLSTGSSVII